jgi:DmsE family decaheme c-type cytochrome
MLVKDTTNATCYTCHAEKRGPFVHNHQPVVEDCGNCHNPHGTTADAMLKARQPFLCQQCHGTSAHPGNVPGVRQNMPNAVSANIGPGMAQARGCSNCHTNIHGSNSPANTPSTGPARFFR